MVEKMKNDPNIWWNVRILLINQILEASYIRDDRVFFIGCPLLALDV